MHGNPHSRQTIAQLAEAGALIAYFGYGSLVNRATLRTRIVAATPARVRGWRREWQPRPDMTLDTDNVVHASLLTARRDPTAEIDGLLVFDHVENLPAVDRRENDYRRHRVTQGDLTAALDDTGLSAIPDTCPVYIYEADPPEDETIDHPILQSYLDAVLQGFHREHGEEGVRAFIAGTARFDTPVLKDRDWPVYPRAVKLDADERALYDGLLAARGVRYLQR